MTGQRTQHPCPTALDMQNRRIRWKADRTDLAARLAARHPIIALHWGIEI